MPISRIVSRVAATLLSAVLVGMLSAGATATETDALPDAEIVPGRIVVVIVEGISAETISPRDTPALYSLMTGDAGIGLLATRIDDDSPTSSDIAASISAGARATGRSEDMGAFENSEPMPNGAERGEAAGVVYQRRTGTVPKDSAVIPGWHLVQARNRVERFGAVPGTLGSALQEAGWSTAVINVGDDEHEGKAIVRRGHAAVVADTSGLVDRVVNNLVREDAGAPAGLVTDTESVLRALATQPTQSVTVLATAELQRAARLQPYMRQAVYVERKAEALESTDQLIGAIVESKAPTDLLMVVLPTTQGLAKGMATVVLSGPGIDPGLLESATTQRLGIIRIQDLGADLANRATGSVPTAMEGRPIRSRSTNDTGTQRFDELQEVVAQSWFRVQTGGHIGILLAGASALVAVLFSMRDRLRLSQNALVFLAAFVPSLVLVSLWLTPVPVRSLSLWYLLMIGIPAAISGALVLAKLSVSRALIALWAILIVTVVVDVVFTTNVFQFNGTIGYGVVSNARFSGIGNMVFAALGAAALGIGHCLVRNGKRGWLVAAALLGFVIFLDGAPSLGEDFGGLLTLTLVGVVALLGWWPGRRSLTPVVAVCAIAIALIVGVLSAEFARPYQSRSHSGRFIETVSLDPLSAGVIIERKMDLMLATLSTSAFRVNVAVVLILFIVSWRRRHEFPLRRLSKTVQASAIAMILLAILGAAINDSGIEVTGMMVAMLFPGFLMLAEADREPVKS